MEQLIILYALCVGICLFSIGNNSKLPLMLSCFIIFLFLALRFEFGYDYKSYSNMFQGILTNDTQIEVGWRKINELFFPLGFTYMVGALSALYVFSIYKVIDRYVPPQYYWLAIMSLIAISSLLFLSASAMRQQAAISIFLFALPYIEKRKIIHYSILIFAAYLFHKSIIVLWLLYFAYNLPKKSITLNISIIVLFIIVSFNMFGLLNWSMNYALSYLDRYEIYSERESQGVSVVGFVYRLTILLSLLYCRDRVDNKILSFILLSAAISTIVSQMALFNNMFGRYSMYFGYFLMLGFPILFKFYYQTKNRIFFSIFFILVILWINTQFVGFLLNPTLETWWSYKTILWH